MIVKHYLTIAYCSLRELGLKTNRQKQRLTYDTCARNVIDDKIEMP